ncbi:hypothetical protein C8P63_11361 [Melghirimyces profundicolus]|uniref:Uncharacterized protein n=1 Tax=Melghirimyces profundicolus TaxID=1242148 RepID=A0A2T6BSV5_9BACL|nr:hypothetical protein C8P63_11361 [Melghirimyces profundicolus]
MNFYIIHYKGISGMIFYFSHFIGGICIKKATVLRQSLFLCSLVSGKWTCHLTPCDFLRRPEVQGGPDIGDGNLGDGVESASVNDSHP